MALKDLIGKQEPPKVATDTPLPKADTAVITPTPAADSPNPSADLSPIADTSVLPLVSQEKGFYVANHPYTFKFSSGVTLKADVFGQYHPETAEQIAELEHHAKHGRITHVK